MPQRVATQVLDERGCRARVTARLAPHAAAGAALLAPPLLAQATRVEVYGLALVLSLVSLRALVRWSRTRQLAALLTASFAAGLAATVHPPHALALVALGAVLSLAQLRATRWRHLVPASVAFLLAALMLAHLPIRAAAGAPMWGEPTTWSELVRYVSARAYAQNVGVAGERALWDQTGAVILYLLTVGPVAALGLVVTKRWTHALGALAMSGAAMLQPLDVAIPDMLAYLAPASVWLLAAGAAALATSTWPRQLSIVALLAVLASPPHVIDAPEHASAHHPVLETLAGAYLDAPTPRAVVVVDTDFVAASWMEARATEGARPDVALVISGLITSSWHWKTFARHPIFDGTPQRGPGEHAREAFLLGVGIVARDRVEVLSEVDRWGLPGVRGPYAFSQPAVRLGRDWLPALVSDAHGLTDTTGAVVRHAVATHVQRLEVRNLLGPALRVWAATSWQALPAAPSPARRLPTPEWVVDPAAFLVSEADFVRLGATLLTAVGETEAAFALLERQRARGDHRASLQAAVIHALLGDEQTTARALDDATAGGLTDEAAALRARLLTR
ncbi:MAG: hypothetical protein KF901_26790 [Myxococcales bacterium]|nr:hypothetical protein [Myxococcales bacterium]